MRIYLLRHGIAEDAGPRVPDTKRELTDKGRSKLAAALRVAKRAEVRPDAILSSPLLRAVQTAEIARDILKVLSPVQQTPALIPEGSPQKVWEELRALRKFDEVLLAGHEPLLSNLAAWLLRSPALQIHVTKGSLLSIEMDDFPAEPHGILNWMITAKMGE